MRPELGLLVTIRTTHPAPFSAPHNMASISSTFKKSGRELSRAAAVRTGCGKRYHRMTRTLLPTRESHLALLDAWNEYANSSRDAEYLARELHAQKCLVRDFKHLETRVKNAYKAAVKRDKDTIADVRHKIEAKFAGSGNSPPSPMEDVIVIDDIEVSEGPPPMEREDAAEVLLCLGA